MKQLIINKHWEINEDYDIDKILYLLIDRPNYISSSNGFIWIDINNKKHRDYDLPVYVCSDGYVAWYLNNKRYRKDNKPTKIFYNGFKKYYLNNRFIKEEK